MADESGVTVAETGMLAENLREPVVSEGSQASVVPDSPKVADAPEKKPPVAPSDAKSKKSPAPAAPAPQQAAAEETPLSGSEQGVQLKDIVTYVQYAVIVLLVIVQVLVASNLSSTGAKLNQIEKTLGELKLETQKREAEQEKKFNEALQDKEQQDTENRRKSIVAETLNRLRDGFPERRLIRRKGGDWYVMGGKDSKEVAIGTPEVIEALNYAHAHARAEERTSQVVPPHTGNAICVLKPDGKGGTQVTTAYDYIIGGK